MTYPEDAPEDGVDFTITAFPDQLINENANSNRFTVDINLVVDQNPAANQGVTEVAVSRINIFCVTQCLLNGLVQLYHQQERLWHSNAIWS